MNKRVLGFVASGLLVAMVSGCVSTEELYAEYDALDCNIVATKDASGSVNLHEQNTDTHYPWEPAVYFAFDSHELEESEHKRLDASMKILKKFPSLVLGLQGFTDKRGTDGYNSELAERRVLAVKAYVVQSGITADRVMLQPIGEVLPEIGGDESVAQAANRRVELMLLDDVGRPMPVHYAMQ